MKKYITGRYDILIEEVDLIRETDVTIWYVDSKDRKQNCRKKSTYSQVWDSFEEAKDYLLKKENDHFEKLSKWLKDSGDRIEKITNLSN